MITVSLGTIPFPFDRAINWLSLLLQRGVISEDVFVQHGTTNVSILAKYQGVTTAPIIETSLLTQKITDSRLVISHAGQGLTKALATQGACFVLNEGRRKKEEGRRRKEEVYICGFRQGTFVGEASSSKLPFQLKTEKLNKFGY
ncbi:MAG: hypothetical protein KME60_12175 [Cyanomargarita calcarea GSE-NOS-MK-12-04C]|jgi:UDP-N-acetylglucosamine transferase subunit ALG13|uniref:Uncharacterized protein n=1 Tax=Cyanomargarita calcarea GSE-NOS-MK-12-04C TaxID=2839659 RepID=A0A951QMF7_9CYAN|nr:hypothetical protein [Cyanomargarita calcarea GSE-NOS-MK-12-04C]